MRWEKWKMSEAMEKGGGPGKRWGHTCNAIRGGKLLYVFGGYGQQNSQTNQVHVFDTDTQAWSEPAIKGTPPIPRDSHTCTTVDDNLFVFGGTDGFNPLGDLHILHTSSNSWISPHVRGDGPQAREGHSAALVGVQLFIFGGCGKSMNYPSEVHYNDLYILNTNTLVWRELNTSGQLLPPRAGHSTVAFGKHIFVFGGFTDAQNLYDDLYMLDVDTGIWTKIISSGDGPSARFSMSGDCLDPSKGGVLVFIGGCNKNLEALDDMYFLHTEILRDDGRDDRRLEKLSLRKQLKMKCQEQYIPSSASDKSLVTFEPADLSQPISTPYNSQQNRLLNLLSLLGSIGERIGQQYFHLNMYRPPIGKRTFQAKVTKNLATGYTIETTIDGKPLRGVLFSTSCAANLIPHGEKAAENVKSKVNENQGSIMISSTVHESPAEPTSASVTKSAEHSDVGQSHEVAIKESETLIGSNGDHEVKKTDGAAASADIATLEDPSSVAEGSAAFLTSQEDQVETAERT
ncbi:acyl-CoA-binding domain-containing protein 6 isoform X6 [Beta vulgaris subsp. vulgaris]|uniref:acyl-CoA-binding domain-containing protein 6 isoform X6 n=1 Tax=Beta vulgaris subsp. vulgaris TaxID=3555 RepID=UPI0020366B42|nr:acyl-CoA-binding domain-containing protein 6 isoform X6 [Beta vulgaris subsp. vulgaris]